jgi:hypothetical protein
MLHCQTLWDSPSVLSCFGVVEVGWPNYDFVLFAHRVFLLCYLWA